MDGAEEQIATQTGTVYTSSPLPNSYLNPLNDIDMNGAPRSVQSVNGNKSVPTSYTKPLNAPRNYLYYWQRLQELRPEAFSRANQAKLANGAAPTVDAEWIAANPTHVGFEGEKLIHHHIEQGNVATAVPEIVHNQYTRDLHPLKYPNSARISTGLGLTMNVFSLAVEAFSKNPNTIWNSTFGNGANVGQVYVNPEGGYYKIINIAT